ncbi:MAG: hypothetical protein GXP25_12900 [Planctomycetes bacterium]|nr:hypothetical protein [Planctomycetota bacterium]
MGKSTPQPGRVPRQRWRRRLVAAALLLLFLFACLLCLLFFRPGWVFSEDWVRERIVTTLREKADRDVEIGHIELPRLGRVKMQDVVLKSREGRLPMMQAKSFTLYVKILPLFRGQVVIKRLRLRDPSFCISTTDLDNMHVGGRSPRPEEIMAHLAVEDLTIRNADAVILDDDGRPAFSIFNFNMTARGAQRQPLDYTMDFHVEAEGIAGKVHATGRLTAFREAGHALNIRELVFQSIPVRAVLAGKVTSENRRINLAIGMDAEGDLGALRRFLADVAIPIPSDLEIKGNSKMRLNLSGPLSDLTVEGAIDVPDEAVTYRGKRLMRWEGKDDLTYSLRRHKNEVELRSVKIRSSLGETIVTGNVQDPDHNPTVDLRVNTTANVTEISKAVPKTLDVSATGELSSRLHISGPATDLKIAGEMDLAAVELRTGGNVLKKKGEKSSLAVDLALRGSVLEIGGKTELKTPVGTLRPEGSIRSPMETPILNLKVSSDMDAAALWARVPKVHRRALSRWAATGAATMEADIEGTPSDLNLSGTFDLDRVVVSHDGSPIRRLDTPLQAYFDLRLTEAEATVNSITISTDSVSARVQGKIKNLHTEPTAALEFDVRGDLDKLVPAARAHGLKLLPETVSLSGPIRITGSATDQPDGTLRVHSSLHIADSEWRHHGIVIKPRRYEPEVRLDCSIQQGRFTVERFLYHSDAVEISGSGGFRDGSRLAMEMKSTAHLERLQSLIEAELSHAVSTMDTKGLPKETAALVRSLPGDVRVSGEVTTTFRFSADLDDIEAGGAVDTADVRIDYRQVPVKKREKRSRLAFNVQAEYGNPVRIGLHLESDVGKTDVNGRIVAGETPELDLLVKSQLDLGRWLASLPIEEIRSDAALRGVLDRKGIDLQLLRDNLRTSGTAKAEFNVTGPPYSPRAAGGIDVDDVAFSVVTRKGKTLLRKAAGVHAKAGMHMGFWGDEFVIQSVQLEYGDDTYAAEGDIAISKGKLVARKLLLRANDQRAEAELDVRVSESGMDIHRLAIRHEKDLWDLSGRIEYTEDLIAADGFCFRLNDSKALVDFKVKNYADPNPEITLLILSPRFDMRPIIPHVVLSPIKPPAQAERPNVTLTLVPEKMPERLASFLRKATIRGKIVIGDLFLDVDDQQDRTPAIRHYRLRNVASHARLRGGVFTVTLKGILNEGMVDFEWSVDLNPDLPANTISYWADRIQANDNLRPLMNYTFNNLYVNGELGFDGRASWQGLSSHNVIRSMQGKTRMYINDGFLLGKAAPEYMMKLFPWLNLHQATWNFKRGEIISVTEGHICINTMRFRYPGSTYLTGQTNNITKEIRYVFGVDLVDSFGLGESTGVIPDRIESKSSIDICRYVGTLDKQNVEWFKLRGDEIMSLLKKLLQAKSFATLFSPKKTPLEKAEHIEGRAVGIITAPARAGRSLIQTPLRVRERREIREIDHMKD